MTPPLFSIATPTRNSLGKLRRCIGSIRAQQGPSFEHLIQDACSTDGTPEWLQAHSAGPQVLPAAAQAVSAPDSGMYDAINRAWSRSNGQYLSWLNADEQYLPGTLAKVAAVFDRFPEVDAVFANYLVVDESGRALALRNEIPLRRFYISNSFLNAQSCTLFFRRSLWEKGQLKLDTRYRYAADKDLVLRMLTAGVRFRHIPDVLSLFGVDGTNLSTHDGMAQEAEIIRLAHGGLRWKPLRALALAGRRAERLLRGAYRLKTFDYSFALDEVPQVARYRAESISGRYSLSDTAGKAMRLDASVSTTDHRNGSNA